MKRATTLMCALFAATSIAAGGAQQSAKTKQQPASSTHQATPKSAKAERYQPLDSTKIVCGVTGVTLGFSNGPVVQSVGKLLCHIPPKTEDVGIELLSNDTPDGKIRTKNFGIIQAEMGTVINPTDRMYIVLSMKPSDASKLDRFLRNHQEQQAPSGTQETQKPQE